MTAPRPHRKRLSITQWAALAAMRRTVLHRVAGGWTRQGRSERARPATLDRLVADGLVVVDGDRAALTAAGRRLLAELGARP